MPGLTPLNSDGVAVDMTTPDNTYGTRTGMALVAPAVSTLGTLSDDEAALLSRLTADVSSKRFRLEMRDAYFRGTVRIADLGISIPPAMRALKIALGWPRVTVEAVDERLNVEGFRFNQATDVDEDLQALWQANDMDAEAQLAHLDALVFGQGYVAVGSNEDDAQHPLITVESPLDVGVEWDARARKMTAAVRLYGPLNAAQATLYLPDVTIFASRTGTGEWSVDDRDEHGLGRVPLVRFANRARSYQREGESEITPEIMSITDEASRTAQGLAVAREFYAAPQRYILGASETDFQNADGTAKSAWQTYLGRVLALERDADGNVPTIGQFQAYDPSVFTKVIEMYAKIMSSVTGLPPHVLGWASDNPTSADAIIKGEMRLKLKADRKTKMFGGAWRDVMQLALLVRDGTLPDGADSISTIWGDTGTPTPAATTDSIQKQIISGAIPATSDVTLERLGWNAVQRQRLAQDRALDQGASLLQEIAHNLDARAFRADNTLAAMSGSPAPTTPTPNVMPKKAPSAPASGG